MRFPSRPSKCGFTAGSIFSGNFLGIFEFLRLETIFTYGYINSPSGINRKINPTDEELSKASGIFGIPGFKWPL